MIWPPPDRALEGSTVRLEPLAEEHREPLRSVAIHPEVWQWIDRRVTETDEGFDEWFDGRVLARKMGDGRMTLQTVACRRPRSLACRARHAPCVLGRLGFRAPDKNSFPDGQDLCGHPRARAGRKHMLMPVTGVRDSAYFSIVDDEWPAVRQILERRLAGAREVRSA